MDQARLERLTLDGDQQAGEALWRAFTRQDMHRQAFVCAAKIKRRDLGVTSARALLDAGVSHRWLVLDNNEPLRDVHLLHKMSSPRVLAFDFGKITCAWNPRTARSFALACVRATALAYSVKPWVMDRLASAERLFADRCCGLIGQAEMIGAFKRWLERFPPREDKSETALLVDKMVRYALNPDSNKAARICGEIISRRYLTRNQIPDLLRATYLDPSLDGLPNPAAPSAPPPPHTPSAPP
jgi:hypothetical protein